MIFDRIEKVFGPKRNRLLLGDSVPVSSAGMCSERDFKKRVN